MTLHTQLKNEFESQYQQQTEQAYYWTVKDATNLKQLIKKISYSYKTKFGSDATECIIKDSFTLILNKLPKWYKENCFDIATINSHYNKIITTIKHENSNDQIIRNLQEKERRIYSTRSN